MIGLGTLLNTASVVAGGFVGLIFKNGLKKSMQDALMCACGVATIFIGTAGALSKMLTLQNGVLETQGTMLLILSLVLGTFAGELLRLEARMDTLGEKIKKAVHRENDSLFVEGFVNVSLIICVGAMAIVGSIQDGVSGDWSMLAVKSILDGIIVMVFASTYGLGAICSAIPIFVYQGLLTLAAAFLGSFIGDAVISDLTFIGSVLIFCVGINSAFGKRFPVGNMLPSLLGPVVYALCSGMF